MPRALLAGFAALALVATGCGTASDGPGSSGGTPSGADLAGDSTQALFEAGSAHYVLDGSFSVEGEEAMGLHSPITLHFEGDYSQETYTGEGTVGWPGGTFNVGFLLGQQGFFLRLFDRWFGSDEYGLARLEAELEKDDPRAAELYRELQTGEGVRRFFDRVLTGGVAEGPDAEGVPTWEFKGTLNADGILGLMREYGAETPPPDQLEAFRRVAEKVEVTFLVGKDDSLLRRLDVAVKLTPEDFAGLTEAEELGPDGRFELALALVLSDFGKSVPYEPPATFEPLEKALEAFFGNWG